MQDSRSTKAALVASVIATILWITPAQSDVLPFPGSGTTYFSATDGTGLIPSGGTSGSMSTAGDFVDQTFTGVSLTSVDSISAGFDLDNALNGSSETVFVYLNGISIASFTVPDAGGVNTLFSVGGSVFFAPIIGNGTYELTMTLQDTVAPDGGFIDFQDGGFVALDGGVRVADVPEPTTLSLVGVGIAAAAALRRRKKKVA